jgi:hypothetical protein
MMNLLGENISTMQENIHALLEAGTEVGLEANAQNTNSNDLSPERRKNHNKETP